MSRLSAGGLSTNDQMEQWAKLIRHRQNLVEEKDKMFSKFSTALQGAEAMYHDLQEDVEVLKSNSSEVWERLKIDEQK